MRVRLMSGGALAAVMLASGLVLGHEVFADDGEAPAERTVSRLVSTTGFTYQGRLETGGVPVDGTCDFQFSMWDSSSGPGGQVGATQSETLVVSDGRFQALLNSVGQFGAFTGDAGFLETAVRCPSGSGVFETLTPRQQLTGTPYAHGLVLPLSNTGSYLSDGLSITNTNVSALGYAAIKGTSTFWGLAGISGTSPGASLQKAGVYAESDNIGVAASGTNYGVSAVTVDGVGVYGSHSGSNVNPGVMGVTEASVLGAAGVSGVASSTFGLAAGVRGQTDSPDASGVVAIGGGTSGNGAALEISNGAIKVTGAGFATTTPAFVHTASAGNSALNYTCIDHPLTNDDPDAILLVTQRWAGVYNNHPIGVFFREQIGPDQWCIFNEDGSSAIPAGALFNVLIIKN